jgi:DDE_Tnp_1-associated/Transposase DDE domain
MKGLIKKTKQQFEGLKDPRTPCPALRHSYAGMLAMVAVAMMFAANGPTAVVRFWNDIAGHRPRRQHGLLRALGLKTLPSHDALGRVMAATDPDALDQAVQAGRRLMDRRGKTAARHRHIAVDGKACRGSASPANGVEAALVVNAIDVDTKQGLATVATPGPGQEVPTARKLLRRQDMGLDGALVSFDAAHCCRETLGLVRSRGGDWLVPVKGNTPTLRDEIMFSLDAAAAKPITVCEKGHGRLDTRTVRVVTEPDTCEWLGNNHGCDGLRTIGHIVYITEERGKKPTREECAFICSRRIGAQALLAEALGRRGGAQPPGRVAGRGCLPRPHRLGSGQLRHSAPLRSGLARHAAGQGRAVARRHLPPPLRLRRDRRHGGRHNGGNVTIPTPRTPPHMARRAAARPALSLPGLKTGASRARW